MSGLKYEPTETWQKFLTSRDPVAKKQLIEHYYKYAVKYAGQAAAIFGDRLRRDDVVSSASYELVVAIGCFDPKRGVPFTKYLGKRIHWIIIAMMRAIDNLTPYERGLLKQYKKAKLAFCPRGDKKTPTDEEICAKLGINLGKLQQIRVKETYYPVQMDALEDHKVDYLLAKLAVGCYIPTPHEIAERRDLVEKVISYLSARDKQIFLLRYLQDLTMAEIGHIVGLTVEGVHTVLTRQKKRLRSIFVKDDSKPPSECDIKRVFEGKARRIKRLIESEKEQ